MLYRLLTVSGLLIVTACAAPQPPTGDIDTDAEVAFQGSEEPVADPAASPSDTSGSEPEAVEYGRFSRDQLNAAILGELGAQRGRLPEAARSYYELARETRDLGVIRRALQFASANGQSEAVLELAQLWGSIHPQSVEPHLLLGYQYLETGNFEAALQHMARVVEMGGSVDFTALTARAQDLPSQQRNQIRTGLEALRQRHPEQASLHYAVIQLLAQEGDMEGALDELRQLDERFGASARGALVRAQLMQQGGDEAGVLETLDEAVRQYPDNRLLRFSYAQVLVQSDELDAAREQFITLARQEPEDYETLYSLALLNLEMESLDEARSLFTRMLDVGYRNNESRFYMGYISEAQGEVSAAIGHYRQVQMDSNNFLNAQRQVIRLLVAEQRFDEAHQWAQALSARQPRLTRLFITIEADALLSNGALERAETLLNAAVAANPDDPDLLFARTLLHERRQDLAAAEADLRRIIELVPDDARALNHLGYTLADRTDRHEEALHLIERAIAIAPDDPAIIDSLGWVQYKLGRHEEAVDNLRRALALFPDHEVAAHLGEVLWVMGKREEAKQVWSEALQRDPDSKLLRDVIERFNPDLRT